jgi:hypothetical protein
MFVRYKEIVTSIGGPPASGRTRREYVAGISGILSSGAARQKPAKAKIAKMITEFKAIFRTPNELAVENSFSE